MASISLCMIVKNEEAVLERCLRSILPAVDEIIIVDTGSTDRTREIAASFTDKVYSIPWQDDFAAARNVSFSYATQDYCMWLDADDVVPEDSLAALCKLKESLDADVVMLPYEIAFDEDGNATFHFYRERLIRRSLHLPWQGRVHEVITPQGNILRLPIPIQHRKLEVHDPDRNLRIFEKMQKEGTLSQPRELLYYGRELYAHGRYEDTIKVLKIFLDQKDGWLENRLDAYRLIADCQSMLGQEEEAFNTLTSSFWEAPPRAEACCRIGSLFMKKNDYKQAIFWYETALHLEKPEVNGTFLEEDYYGFLPAIQLCCCYYQIGELEKSKRYHRLSAMYRPHHPSVLYNERFFESQHLQEKG